MTVLWAHNPTLVKIDVAFTKMILISSGHNFVHVTTAELSLTCTYLWLDWVIKTNIKARMFTRFQLWALKLLVAWIPDNEIIHKDGFSSTIWCHWLLYHSNSKSLLYQQPPNPGMWHGKRLMQFPWRWNFGLKVWCMSHYHMNILIPHIISYILYNIQHWMEENILQ